MSTGFHLLAVVIIWSQRAQAADILVATNTFGSHWLNLAKIAEALTSRGHIVTVVAPASEKSDLTTKWPSFRYETFGDPEKAPLFIEVLKNTPPEIMAATDDCQNMLSDIQLLRRLRNSHYNVVLTYPGMSCGSLVAQYLDLPLVCTLMFMPFVLEIQATGVPNPVSYIPTVMLGLTDQMTFLQRVKNTLVYFGLTIMGQVIAERGFDAIASSRTIGSNFTIFSALARTDVWLYQTGVMFDYPKPTMPNMVSIAGYMADEAKPLSEDLESFMQSSGDAGVVIVTFGNLITAMPAERAEMLAAAFSRLPQKVVWRNAGTPPPSLGPNTRIMEWLPQSDLLALLQIGSPSGLRAICLAAGLIPQAIRNAPISEAMYHGVPLVGMPLFADQHENIARVVARGMAVTLDIHTVTSEEVYQAITAVIFNPKYKEKAKRVSTILRDQPQPPMERAVWWIEHVIKHGGLPHLRSRATELPFYQYYLLDVLALIVSVLAVILLAAGASGVETT
ncbi:UDP-glucuronosyltransferase 2A1 [Branchiostoma belcheri]|nr:UDP-glucuronosyltransferase 2A1 [Branchiostoma belcheri]